MSVKIIQERFESYHCGSEQEETNALKEITQEIALAGLSRTDFFKQAAFQGGTCLRVLYSLDRFSEDLDFILKESESRFSWETYFKDMEMEFRAYGIDLKIEDRSVADETVKKAFLKDNSIGKILVLKHRPKDRRPGMIRIKFEIDTNPPSGGSYEMKYLDFPFPFAINVQDPPTLFAGKSHALLCRGYIKGRDWYDFLWYVQRKIPLNFKFLSEACDQNGPWQGKGIAITKEWYLEEMEKKIRKIDWTHAREDVARFLKPRDLPVLDLWSSDFFLDRLHKQGASL